MPRARREEELDAWLLAALHRHDEESGRHLEGFLSEHALLSRVMERLRPRHDAVDAEDEANGRSAGP